MLDRINEKKLQIIRDKSESLQPQEETRLNILDVLSRNRERGIEKPSENLEDLMKRYNAINFLQKFDRQKEGRENYFEVGEKIAAPFIIVDTYNKDRTIDNSKIGLMVERIDTRVSDTFIVDVTPEEYKMCQQYKGMEFNGVVEITGPAKYKVSNMFKYSAKAIKLEFNLPINPESVDNMELGDRVTVEGEIVDFRVIEHWSSNSEKTAIITLKTKTGEHIFVQIDHNVKLEQSSELENIRGKKPEIGDFVRINAIVRKHDVERPEYKVISANPTVESYFRLIEEKEEKLARERKKLDIEISSTQRALQLTHDEDRRGQIETSLYELRRKKDRVGVKVISANWCRSTYLIKPNEDRENRYGKLRGEVNQGIQEVTRLLESESYQDMRNELARLIKLEVTVAERNELNRLAFLMPENGRPLMLWARYEADEINTLFDVDIDVMTLSQFYEFVHTSVQTPYSLGAKKERRDHSYLFGIMDVIGMLKEQQEELMVLSIDVRWKYFQELESKGEIYDHDRDWSDKYMLEQSLGYLSRVRTPSSVQRLIDFSYEIIMAEDLSDDRKGEFTYKAVDSLRYGFYATEENPELLKVYQQNEQKIREMEARLVGIQSQRPDSSTAPLVFIPENIGQPAMVSQPTINHRFSYELRDLRQIIDGINPELKQLKEGDFGSELMNKVSELAGENRFFYEALKAIREKGFKFVLFEQGDPSIPKIVQETMTGGNGAVTVKKIKTTYFDLNTLQSYAFQRGTSTDKQLIKTLIDESYHIMSDVDYTPILYDQTLLEVDKMATTSDYLESEKMMQSVIEEEIVAHMMSELISQQVLSHSLVVNLNDFAFPDGSRIRNLVSPKIQLGVNVLKRVYALTDEDLVQDQFKPILERLVEYLNSGKIEKKIQDEVKRFGLVKE